MTIKALQSTARLIASPAAPYSEIRTAGCILGVSSYVIAKQLMESGKLDTFALPMTNLALSSGLVLANALKKLCSPQEQPGTATEAGSTTTGEAPAALGNALGNALQNIASALSLAGSSGLLSNWVLNRQACDTNAANAKALVVPVTFANAAVFKLVVNSGAMPNKAMPYARCLALTGMMLGSALFAELALTEREDVALFAVSCTLCAGLLPQTLIAIRDVFLALSSRDIAQARQNTDDLELPGDTRHTAMTDLIHQK